MTNTSATLIDHIWTNNFLNNVGNGVLFARISDHFPIYAIFRRHRRKINTGRTITKRRNLNDDNIALFRECLTGVCWSLVYASKDPNVFTF